MFRAYTNKMAMVGGFGAEKTDAELLALFTTPEVLSAVNALLSATHAKIVPLALKTQVVRVGLGGRHLCLSCPALRPGARPLACV
jgi:hypothetical protein